MIDVLAAIAAFIVTIGILVSIHEYGHLLAARLMGVGVIRYSIGFGPKLWSRVSKRSGIEYQIAAIPLGGYVKMHSAANTDEPDPDTGIEYEKAHPWRRLVILAAGPGVNVIFALAAYWLVFMMGTSAFMPIIDTPAQDSAAASAGLRAHDTILAVNNVPVATWQATRLQLIKNAAAGHDATLAINRQGHTTTRTIALPDTQQAVADSGLRLYQPPPTTRIAQVHDDSVAARAGLRIGDVIMSAAGQRVTTGPELVDVLASHADETIPMTAVRDGLTQHFTVTLGPSARLGVSLKPDTRAINAMRVHVLHGPVVALDLALGRIQTITYMTWHFVSGMFNGSQSTENLAGPVAIATTGAHIASLGVTAFIGFLGLISLSLGLFNLIPLPVLDGGQMVLTGAEWLIRRPLPMVVHSIANGAGMALLALVMVMAMYNDIARLVTG